MKILVLSPIVSHPAVSGARVRINRFCSFLKESGHTIHFVHYNIENVGEYSKNCMQNTWDTYTEIKKTKEFEKNSNEVFLVDDWYQENITKKIQQLCRLFDIDTVLVNYIFMTKIFEFLPSNIKKILDTHDKLSGRLEVYLQNNIEPGFFYTSEAEEIKALNRADIVIAIQEEENKYFKSVCSKKVVTINHLEKNTFINNTPKKLKKIGYMGAVNKFNIVSIQSFIKSFQTKLADSKLTLVIAGNICKHISDDYSFVEKIGFVDSLEEFYTQVDLVVNPTIVGTGLKIKSVEALAYGIPVVSTSIGFDGLYSTSKYHTSSNTDELVEHISTLYFDRKEFFSLRKSCQTLYNQYETAVKNQITGLFPFEKSQTLKNHDMEVIALYKQLVPFKNQSKQKFENQKELEIYKRLKELASIKLMQHPLLKLRAYKELLEYYHVTK